MEIQRHEINGILQGFSFYSENEISVLQHNDTVYYSNPAKYRGWGSFGAANSDSIATAFATTDEAMQYITENGLIKHGGNEWHEDTEIRVFLELFESSRLIKDYPEMASFGNLSYIEPDGVYIYLNFIESEHETLLLSYNAIIETHNPLTP